MEGEMVSGTMTGIGSYYYQDKETGADIRFKGLFQNDRPQGFGMDSRPSGDPDHPIAHRLAVYQRGKQICYLDELRPGARVTYALSFDVEGRPEARDVTVELQQEPAKRARRDFVDAHSLANHLEL